MIQGPLLDRIDIHIEVPAASRAVSVSFHSASSHSRSSSRWEGRVQRTLEGPGRNRGNLLNALGDGVAVNGTGGDDLKDGHIESSLRNSAFSGGMVGT
jgi:hypothetical protein